MKRFILALTLLFSCSATAFAQQRVVFKPIPTPTAEQFVVVKDRAIPLIGELQEKFPRGTKPEMQVLDYRGTSRETKEYVRRKPSNASYPYFYLLRDDGLIIAQGELANTIQENVEFVAKFQAKPKAADVPPRAVMLQSASGVFLGGIVYVGGTQYTVQDVTIFKLPAPGPDQPPVVIPSKVTRVTYVWEKDQSTIPRPVAFALQKLNAGGSILASEFEEDTVDGTGEVPDQYKVALEAARREGPDPATTADVPVLVVQAGSTVVRVVKAPKTEAEVLEAAK